MGAATPPWVPPPPPAVCRSGPIQYHLPVKQPLCSPPCRAPAEGEGLQELELGASSDAGVPQRLLFLQSGSLLVLEQLNLTGIASPAVGKVGLPTGIDVSALLPVAARAAR